MKKLIIDFDSTLVKVETLDKLAEKALENNIDCEKILCEIKNITELGMVGEITFPESLSRRIALIRTDRKTVAEVAKTFEQEISSSVLANLDFFEKNKEDIFIITGGFEDLIFPTTDKLGIERDHVLANRFVFNEKGFLTGVDKNSLLANVNGKSNQIKALGLQGEIVIVGDGWTDFEVRRSGVANKFIAYVENVSRENVTREADYVAKDFGQVIEYFNNI
ncbi:MAG: HAD-IB family phosphatase [Candidatus Moraniibacteriota bacterium]|jgi:D-3-phosphoglycerate dehydrogenase